MKKVWTLLVALCVSVVSLVGCGGPPPDMDGVFVDNPEEHYNLKFYMPSMGTMTDLPAVVEEVNKITEREINASIEIVAFNYYEYSSKITNVIASSEKFDICHTSPAINHYFLNVQRKAFYPVDYLLDTYAPVTKSLISEDLWKQLEVGANVHKLQVIEEDLAWLRQTGKGLGGYTSRIDATATLQNFYGFDDLSTGMNCPGAVQATDDLKDGKLKVVNQFETDEFKELVEYATRWRQMGYINKDKISSSGGAQDYNVMDIVFDGTWKPGAEQTSTDGTVRRPIQLSEPTYFSSFILGTMNAISSRSENPARAMKFIELMSSNKELHNLLQFGIEGKHYTKVEGEENRISLTPNSSYDNKFFGWGLGNEFNSYVYGAQPADMHEQSKKINETARKPAIIGFNFDPEPVKQKIADCLAVSEEFVQLLSEGGFPDQQAKYNEFIQRLKQAGADDIVKEKQRQVDLWVAQQLAK